MTARRRWVLAARAAWRVARYEWRVGNPAGARVMEGASRFWLNLARRA